MPPRRTVLVVENDGHVRKFLSEHLTKHGWIVTAVDLGDDALARLAAASFDVVLCDLDLGRGPSGLDVLRQKPSRNATTPFVILTGHGSTGRCREAFLLGAADFLEKPLSSARLLASLDHVVADAADLVVAFEAESASPALVSDAAGAEHVRRALAVMERRYREFDLQVEDVAQEVEVTPEYLARLFRALLGRSPLEQLHEIRINIAEELMAQSRLSIYEIGYDCGYQQTSKFSSWFRRLRGALPSESRNRGR